MDALGQPAQLPSGAASSSARVVERRAVRARGLPDSRRSSIASADQALLRAVVEVTLELAARGCRPPRRCARARRRSSAQPRAQVGLQALVLQRDPGRAGHRADQQGARRAATTSWTSAATGSPRRSTERGHAVARVGHGSDDRLPDAGRRSPPYWAPRTPSSSVGSRSARASVSRNWPGAAGSRRSTDVSRRSPTGRAGHAAGRRGRPAGSPPAARGS